MSRASNPWEDSETEDEEMENTQKRTKVKDRWDDTENDEDGHKSIQKKPTKTKEKSKDRQKQKGAKTKEQDQNKTDGKNEKDCRAQTGGKPNETSKNPEKGTPTQEEKSSNKKVHNDTGEMNELMTMHSRLLEALFKVQATTPGNSELLQEIMRYHNLIVEKAAAVIERNAYLQGKLEKSESGIHQKTYSEVLKQPKETTQPTEEKDGQMPRAALLIRTDQEGGQTFQEVKRAVQNNFQPEHYGLKDVTLKTIRGGVAVSSVNAEGLEKLSKAITENSETKHLKTRMSEGKNPEIKIIGIDESIPDSEIVGRLLRQNQIPGEEENVKITWSTRNNGTKQISIRLKDREMARKMMSLKKVLIGWSRCPIYENVYIPRCSWCTKYGHTERRCTSEDPICTECSQGHTAKYCNSQAKRCPACYRNGDTQAAHSMWDRDCPYYKLQYEKLKREMGL